MHVYHSIGVYESHATNCTKRCVKPANLLQDIESQTCLKICFFSLYLNVLLIENSFFAQSGIKEKLPKKNIIKIRRSITKVS